MKNQGNGKTHHQVIIVGAGPAGIGLGVALQDFGISDFIVLEKNSIGSTFLKWADETRLLTPSFQSTQFGLLDLNAVAINTSPAYYTGKEHLNGTEYASYLRKVAHEFQLPIYEGQEVIQVEKGKQGFSVHTVQRSYQADYLIWATGEYQFPNDKPFPGAEFCLHTSRIQTYRALKGKEYTIIGGYESGVDAALHLASLGKDVIILEKGSVSENKDQDPSLSLSFYTRQRLDENPAADRIRLEEHTEITAVTKHGARFHIHTKSGYYDSGTPPILATGYGGGELLIQELFEFGSSKALLNEFDESTVTPGLYLIGPHVVHEDTVFCFIYKFRQRFGVIANRIAIAMSIDTTAVRQFYEKHNMFLDDLTCCKEDCIC